MVYVEFPQVQYIDLGAIVYVLKSVAIVTSAHSWTLIKWFLRPVTFWVLRCPLNGDKLGFRDPQKVSLSTEERCLFNKASDKYKDYENIYPGQKFCVPWMGGGGRRGSPKEEVPLYYYYYQKLLKQKKKILGDIARLDKKNCLTIWRKV